MNPSEEITELMQMTIPLEEYCFAYANEDITVQVATRNTKPADLVGAFVYYMKAVSFSSEAIEEALYNKATVMKACRVLGSILEPKKTENTDEVPGPKERLRVNADGTWHLSHNQSKLIVLSMT